MARAPKTDTETPADPTEVPATEQDRAPSLLGANTWAIREVMAADAPPLGLQAKLASVLADVRRIPKLGYNSAQKYAFAREGDIADMIRDSLAAHRVSFKASIARREAGDLAVIYNVITSNNGTQGVECIVDLDITLTCGDTGETQEAAWQGVATDYTDKALPKALTAAKKTFLVFTFLVSTGDEEPDATGIQRGAPPRQQQAQHQQQGSHQHGQATPTADQIKAGRNADGSPDQRKASEPQRRRLFAMAKESVFLTTQGEKGRKVNDVALHNLVAWVTRKPDIDPAGPVTSLSDLTKWQMARVYKVLDETNANAEMAGQVAAAMDEWIEAQPPAEAKDAEAADAEPKDTTEPVRNADGVPVDADGNELDEDEPADEVARNPGSSEHDASIPFGDDDTPEKEASSDEGA